MDNNKLSGKDMLNNFFPTNKPIKKSVVSTPVYRFQEGHTLVGSWYGENDERYYVTSKSTESSNFFKFYYINYINVNNEFLSIKLPLSLDKIDKLEDGILKLCGAAHPQSKYIFKIRNKNVAILIPDSFDSAVDFELNGYVECMAHIGDEWIKNCKINKQGDLIQGGKKFKLKLIKN